jgi:hypothetical protein
MAMQAAGITGPYGSQTRVVSKKCLLTAGLLLEPIKYTLSNIIGKYAPGILGQIMKSNVTTAIALPYTVDTILNECQCSN